MKYFLCIILPPAAVLLANRKAAFVLNLILTLCFWLPGVIHAFFVVSGAESERRHKEMLAAMKEQGKQPTA